MAEGQPPQGEPPERRKLLLDFPPNSRSKRLEPARKISRRWCSTSSASTCPTCRMGASTTRPSGAGNYLAVTVTFIAQSQEQLDAIYMELTAQPRVKMLL